MNWNINKTLTAVALPLIAVSTMLSAARGQKNCEPTPPAACYPDDCCRTYCMGPDNYGVNAAVRPRTCNGDWVVTIAGLYWNAHQDGMEYAVETEVIPTSQSERNSLINANYKNPDFDWNYGFKFGIGYNTTCDGWDIGVVWTNYNGKASSHDEAEEDDNRTLLTLWSNFSIDGNEPTFASDIQTCWNLKLDLVDIELGREFWNSKRVSFRPHIGIRYAALRQSFEIQHKGGTWSEETPHLNNTVDLDNDFKGTGIRFGLDSTWNFGCGWAIYGNFALSILYGRFHFDHDEQNRLAVAPFTKLKILEADDGFRVSRLATDLSLGVQYAALFCQCQYGIMIRFGWEQHLFLDQNQMWRVVKDTDDTSPLTNSFHQRRGDLDTQGWTLTFRFDF
ncbi:MAG: hypothetical protein K1000chlam2_01010 [Chlamydiae bacterium]|nr:hypothetical protein [Chlamydiota bacterium]